MTATNHGLFGSFIAITLQAHPAVAIGIAPFSHFLLDALPHYGDPLLDLHGRKFFKILTIDAILAVVTTLVIAWIWSDIAILIIACAFLAASPDLMWIYYVYKNKSAAKKHLVPRFHGWIQWSQTPNGAYIELGWFLIFFVGLMYTGII
jgi:hypothetical protein